jgi:hypothetical protein
MRDGAAPCAWSCKTNARANFREADFFGSPCVAESAHEHETSGPFNRDVGYRDAGHRRCPRAAADIAQPRHDDPGIQARSWRPLPGSGERGLEWQDGLRAIVPERSGAQVELIVEQFRPRFRLRVATGYESAIE